MEKVDILFSVFDASDLHALMPVFKELLTESIDFRVLNLGSLISDFNYLPPRFWLKWNRKGLGRTESLPASAIEEIGSYISPRLFFTGAVSQAQLQLAKYFQTLNSGVTVYFESFEFEPNETLAGAYARSPFKFATVSNHVSRELRKLNPHAEIETVGQPRYDQWNLMGQGRPQNLSRDRKIILYTGTYCESHRELFTLFAQAAPGLSNFNLIGTLHPRSDGSIEREVLARLCVSNLKFLDKTIETIEAAATADLVVCHRSTLGLQALFMGKPVVYLDTPGSQFTDIPIRKSWARIVYSSEDLVTQIQKELNQPAALIKDIYEVAEVPRHGAKKIIGYIKCQLQI